MNWWQIIVTVSLTLYGRWLWDKVQAWRADQAAEVESRLPRKTITARLLDVDGNELGRAIVPHGVGSVSVDSCYGRGVFHSTDWQYEIDGETIVIFQEVE